MFRTNASKINFKPADGTKVLVTGRISIYEATGNYQIYVDEMQEDGVGNLYIAFEKLKKQLSKECLFYQSHKRQIPKIPKKVGIITASTGAAVRDIITTISRRFPVCETILFPTLVQGENAKDDIVRNIARAKDYDLDVLIIGRGGGSIEDLWPFNEEIVARAIYECEIPTISAVGHEIDFTIADFVADLRAPTPTGAAEMAVPTVSEINNIINSYEIRLNEFIGNLVHKNKLRLEGITSSYILKNPLSLYEIKEQKLDNLIDTLNNNINKRLENSNLILNNIKNSYVLKNPLSLFEVKKEHLIYSEKSLYHNIKNIIIKNEHNYKLLVNTLKLVNPLGILEKGYSLVTKDNELINNCESLKKDDIINIRFHKGNVEAVIKGVKG